MCMMLLTRSILMSSILLVLHGVAALPALAGSIRVTLECPDAPRQAWAVERRVTPTGIYMHETPGTIDGHTITVTGLTPGLRYDLRIETAMGQIEGWDTLVPPSDYEQEQPLSDTSRAAIFAKIEKMERRAFYDDVAVLDVAGNIHHAAVLVFKFHHRGFVEDVNRGPRLVWRVDRMQYEDPEEQSWVPHPKLALYALQRHRVTRSQYDQLRALYDRRLGGIAVTEASPDVDLGVIVVPAPPLGVHACDEMGRIITPVRLKPDPQIEVLH
jgi:hypothetical protein